MKSKPGLARLIGWEGVESQSPDQLAGGESYALLPTLCGCTPPNNIAIAQSGSSATQPGTASVLDADGIELRYVLPEQDVTATSTAAKWSLAAPVEGELSIPNRVVYDQAYMEKYVEWAANAPIACGPATYVIVTPDGERSFVSGQDEAYLGVRFKAEDLLEFLETRTTGKRIERTFRVDNAEAVKV